MFSGIVEEMGIVKSLETNPASKLWDGTTGEGVELVVEGKLALDGAALGCSIAVNGVCLTATELSGNSFRVGLAPETLRLTNLADAKPGEKVNLERALASGARNSGHFVQGHVDGMGTILSMTPEGDSLWVKVETAPEILRYIVPKGFVAVDGTSLTVCEVNRKENWFTFMLVAYTQQHIVIPLKTAGSKLNIEVDVLGKYVERSLASVLDRLAHVESILAKLPENIADGGKLFELKATQIKVEQEYDYRMGMLDHKIKNRDLIIEALEERLLKLENAKKPPAE